MFFRLFYLDNVEALYNIPIFFDILFLTSSTCLFQVIFSSIITPRNLIKNSRFISILLKVIVGNLNGIPSRTLCLWKNRYLVFPALRDSLFAVNHSLT